ncbi:acyl-CoA dehydrogenase family protein [Ideonella azotifigens]|uniref:Acyl-CoA dehydrogenase family protein n=1 Tax=Ideonella azotifigens TaxID=513160 RepID=A0ABP3UV76_9BURK|nr:acyl-CoA dehydrogenase family protein [Ideonella azotifigens]MCD2339898.1 acyl-CoA dehydrogenase family protein [Ideonella azotifigens]
MDAVISVADTTERLARRLEATAVERDRSGGHAAAERVAIRDSGLLGLTIPRSAGGLGADWPTFYGVVRQLAQADSALAHVFAFHHLQIATVLLYGSEAQQRELLPRSQSEGWFWGNALNPLDTRLVATVVTGGWQLDGQKSYASGSVGSDRLVVSAVAPRSNLEMETQHPPAGRLILHLDTRAPGVTVREDWDSFGQRQTDSGTVLFERVFVPQRDLLQGPDTPPTPRATLRTLVSQLIMANLYLGLAQAAFEAGRRHTLEKSRPWLSGNAASLADEPLVQHRYGELWLQLRPAQLVTDAAAQQLQAALDAGDALTAAQRGELAVEVAEAKVLAHRAAMAISSDVFELAGASATSQRLALDRFWRNARVHTLHDPVDLKQRDIGRFRLDGRPTEPSPYA